MFAITSKEKCFEIEICMSPAKLYISVMMREGAIYRSLVASVVMLLCVHRPKKKEEKKMSYYN